MKIILLFLVMFSINVFNVLGSQRFSTSGCRNFDEVNVLSKNLCTTNNNDKYGFQLN